MSASSSSVEDLEAMFPKKVVAVIEHYNECFKERGGCLHCNDCIAYALIMSEALNLSLPSRGIPYSLGHGHIWNFVKFLGSTISLEYLPCPRALPYEQVREFALSLLRLPIEMRKLLRGRVVCHAEFQMSGYNDGLVSFRGVKS